MIKPMMQLEEIFSLLNNPAITPAEKYAISYICYVFSKKTDDSQGMALAWLHQRVGPFFNTIRNSRIMRSIMNGASRSLWIKLISPQRRSFRKFVRQSSKPPSPSPPKPAPVSPLWTPAASTSLPPSCETRQMGVTSWSTASVTDDRINVGVTDLVLTNVSPLSGSLRRCQS